MHQNKLVAAIEALSDSTYAAFTKFLQQQQMAEEFEWRQLHWEREEECAR
jgi:hypothetical protein